MTTPNLPMIILPRGAWNRGRIIDQKRPIQPKHVLAIRVRLELALFNSKSRKERAILFALGLMVLKCLDLIFFGLADFMTQTTYQHDNILG